MRDLCRARHCHWTTAAALAVAAGGCSTHFTATGAAFTPVTATTEQATVYVYQLPGNGRGYRLTVNGEPGPVIGPGAYYGFVTDPGTVEIATKVHLPAWRPALLTRAFSGQTVKTIDAEAGRTYYLRGTQSENPALEQYDMILIAVSEAIGSAEVRLCRLSN